MIIVIILYGHKSFELLSFFTQILHRVDQVIISTTITNVKWKKTIHTEIYKTSYIVDTYLRPLLNFPKLKTSDKESGSSPAMSGQQAYQIVSVY